MIKSFLENLAPPVCLIAHNGDKFDFPLLKSEFLRNNFSLSEDILCADSLTAFRAVDEMKRVKNGNVDLNQGYDRFHNINLASAKLSDMDIKTTPDVKRSPAVVGDVQPVGPSVLDDTSVDATPDLPQSKPLMPPPLKRKQKDCGCARPHGNTELETCFSAKRRLVFPQPNVAEELVPLSTSPCVHDSEETVTSSVNLVRRKLFDTEGGPLVEDNGERTPLRVVDHSLNGVDVLEGATPPSDCIVVHANVEEMLHCDENLDTPERKAPNNEFKNDFDDDFTDEELLSAVESAEKSYYESCDDTTPKRDSVLSSITKIVEKNNIHQVKPAKRSLFADNTSGDKSVASTSSSTVASEIEDGEIATSLSSRQTDTQPEPDKIVHMTVQEGAEKVADTSTLAHRSSPMTNPKSTVTATSSAVPAASTSGYQATPKTTKPAVMRRKSYKLPDIHKRVVGFDLEDAHCAEADCLGLVRIFRKSTPALFQWIDNHAVKFNSVSALPVSKKVPLDINVFPYQLEENQTAT